jgi:hypothetical protein
MSVIAMFPLDLDCAIARSRGDARVDPVALAVLLSRPEVADVSRFQWQDACLADAHPAAEWHLDAYFLAGFQK